MCTASSPGGGLPSPTTVIQNENGQHGLPGLEDPFNDPLNLTGKHTPAPIPLPTVPEDSIGSGDLNKIAYDQQLVQQQMLTANGQQSTILTGPTGLKPNPRAPGMGAPRVAPPPTLIGG